MGWFDRFRRRPDANRTWSMTWPSSTHYAPNAFQLGRNLPSLDPSMASSAVYACVSVIAQEIARLQVNHWVNKPDGSRERRERSEPLRILRRPNSLLTRSDLMLHTMSSVLTSGNAYWTAVRGVDRQISEIQTWAPEAIVGHVDSQTGMIFYETNTSPLYPNSPSRYPQRDVFHMRLFASANSLEGMSPIVAAHHSLGYSESIKGGQTRFWDRSSRPDGILTSDQNIPESQMQALGQAWESRFGTEGKGGTAVLSNGLKFQAMSMTAVEAEIIAQLNWGVDDIARVYRVPLWMINRMEAATYNNVETAGRMFVMQTLGFWVQHLELAMDRFFNLPRDEYLQFDLEAGLLRSDFQTRMEAYRTGIQGGVLAPNESRRREGLPPVEGGDEVFLQAQMEPVEQRAEEPEPVPAPLAVVPPVEENVDAAARAHPHLSRDPSKNLDEVSPEELAAARARLELAHENGVLRQKLEAAKREDQS